MSGAALTPTQRRARLEQMWVELEWRRCANGVDGFLYFCRNYVWVRSKRDARGREKFDLFDYQEGVAADFFTRRFLIVLKARQLGLTTLAMSYSLWLVLFRPGGATILVISKNQKDANANVEMVQHMWRFLPDWMRTRAPKLMNAAADRWVWEHRDGSTATIESMVATAGSGASRTADLVVADEMALWATPEETYRALSPTTDAAASGPGESVVMICISTARGAKNYFARLFRDAKAGRNRFKSVFFPWHVSRLNNPLADTGGVDRSIFEAKRSEYAATPWLFAAEYPETVEDAFRSSGSTRFSHLPSSEEFDEFPWRGELVRDGDGFRFMVVETGPVRLAFDPTEEVVGDRVVVIGADPATGVGADSAVAYALAHNSDGSIEVLGYVADNRLEPTAFGDVLNDFGRFFARRDGSPALIACEYQPSGGGGGMTVVGRLRDLSYPNLYRYVQPMARGRRTLDYYGFPITRSTRPLIINHLAELLVPDEATGELGLIAIPAVLRDELGSFVVREDGSVAADVGAHDDHVMAVAIAAYVARQQAPSPTNERPGEDAPETGTRITLNLSHVKQDLEERWRANRQSEARLARQWTRSSRNRSRR
jgi:hypothetical protein